jgi:hypothetical protein
MLPPHWPSEADIVKLAVASWGLFIFASTLAGYIAEEDPVQRLEHIKTLIEQSGKRSRSSREATINNPFKLLDILYGMIMSDVAPGFLPIAKSILGFSILGRVAFQTTSTPSESDNETNTNSAFLLDVCNILSLNQHTTYGALRKLHSVLVIPPPEWAHREGVRFRHVSFSEFLVKKHRSTTYHVSLEEELLKIWQGYSRITKQAIYPPGTTAVVLSRLLHLTEVYTS